MDWYPWFLRDYRRDTRHLTLAEHGAYRQLLDEYMDSREPLPDDDRALSAIVGCGLQEWLEVARAVRAFFHAKNGKLFHKRCAQEILAQNARFKRNSEKGKKAAFVRWSNHSRNDAYALHQDATLTLRKNSSLTSTQQEVAKGAFEEERKKILSVASPELDALVRRKSWR